MSAGSVVAVGWWAVAHRFGFQWLEFKLGWSAGAAAWPHAWPLALSRRSLLLAAFTAGIVDSGAKSTRKSETWAAAGIASRASDWRAESSFAVGAHRAGSAPVICSTAARSASTSSASASWSINTSISSTTASRVVTAARIEGISASSAPTASASLF